MGKYIEIGKRIKQARMNKQLSQRDLAKRLNCSAPLLTQFEKGNRKPELVDAFRLELILGIKDESISQLVIGEAYRAATGFAKTFLKHGGGTEKVATRSVQSENVISVPVKMPKEIYLKLEFQ